MKWRLMKHNEMDYRNSEEYPDHAYITCFPENHHDPLYSIDICDGLNEKHNTSLALYICEELNKLQSPVNRAYEEDDGILGK